MRKYTLIFRHDSISGIEVRFTVESALHSTAVAKDAAMLIEEIDDMADDAGFEGMAAYLLVAIECDGLNIVSFA